MTKRKNVLSTQLKGGTVCFLGVVKLDAARNDQIDPGVQLNCHSSAAAHHLCMATKHSFGKDCESLLQILSPQPMCHRVLKLQGPKSNTGARAQELPNHKCCAACCTSFDRTVVAYHCSPRMIFRTATRLASLRKGTDPAGQYLAFDTWSKFLDASFAGP